MVANFCLKLVAYSLAIVLAIVMLETGAVFTDDCNLNVTDRDDQTIKIAVLLPTYPIQPLYVGKPARYPFFSQMVLPAINMALQTVRRTTLQSREVILYDADTQCKLSTSQFRVVDLQIGKKPDMFLGPGCEYATAGTGRFVGHWGIPHVTAGGLAGGFREQQKEEFPTLTRVQGSFMKQGAAVSRYFLDRKWNISALVFFDTEIEINDCYMAMGSVYRTLVRSRTTVKFFSINKQEEDYTGNMAKDLLQESVRPNARIVVMCASGDSIRKIMLAAHELGMTNGEYAFFNIFLFDSNYFGDVTWKRGDKDDEAAKQAYRSLMTFTLRKPETPKFEAFAAEVKERALRDYNFSFDAVGEEVNTFVGAFHDAVILYALALNETLEEGGNPRDGKTLTHRMWNRTFEGIMGNVTIDSNGDREADYSLLEMTDIENGIFTVAGHYDGVAKKYTPVPGVVIDWPGKTPPKDVPDCGFKGEFCIEEDDTGFTVMIMMISMVVVIIVAAIIIIYVVRKYRLEMELANMVWKIKWEDITFNNKMDKQRKLTGSRVSLASGESGQSVWGGNQQIFTVTGYYKGNIIAIKKVNRLRVELTRNVLIDFKHMRDISHDHVTKFIGACIDPPNISVMTEYCPKGSLQDILENDSIELDEMFKYSLLYDIVKGMYYLHNSVIQTHGNLKSSNCVVDNRFVVKITDFGLHSFREPDHAFEPDEDDSFQYYQKRLWSAPELLRLPEMPLGGTQKADVYSFGIIVQEVIYRESVFYVANVDLSPKEIIHKVKQGNKPTFRPTLDRSTCPDEICSLCNRCWAEEPTDRPDFSQLRIIMRKLNKQNEGRSLVDNLLSRMEQYATNLEALVLERTEAFYEEKRKAEELLYQILPRPVAEELKKGKPVTAESFECVTIYFSDIVGFTSLSSESTPLQVVDLLNDLYTCFDSIVNNYDVYKVETIGDAYMVASGLPVRNGDFHAREVARMSLALLSAIKTFKIRHKPDRTLMLRIGLHSGPVVAGVVGLKMPRYCLFGDTVNTASRMESNGEAMKIHISSSIKKILDLFGTFVIELRGEVEMKGKGKQTTYWLLGELKDKNGLCDFKYQEIPV
ncbi:atrial natriuretic peptide receptor 1-like isoform X2 [Acanthaster planci]|uniref:Guanylate cyclase n=1 Tax=Acanthaster planci TaxID=133434 RepID=A0A8B7Y1V5_ACAPL|nr:atrial natriuretic peptide receptor 1-like isoform X2 [Acanthaster planci]